MKKDHKKQEKNEYWKNKLTSNTKKKKKKK